VVSKLLVDGMGLQEEINSIINDEQLSYNEKSKKLLKFLAPHEVRALLQKPIEVVKLKEPFKPKRDGDCMRILNLSVHWNIFKEIIKGAQDIECRDYNEYFKSRCTYVENGVRYLVPYDAITFYVGRDNNVKRATVALKDIILDDGLLYFYLGDVLETNVG